MSTLKSSAVAEVQTLKDVYAALNRGDVSGFVSHFDPSIERVESFGGTCQGLEALTDHVASARSRWAEGSCEPTRFTVIGNRVAVSTQVRVRLKNEAKWHEGIVTDVFTFRDGKITQFYSFLDEDEALSWAKNSA